MLEHGACLLLGCPNRTSGIFLVWIIWIGWSPAFPNEMLNYRNASWPQWKIPQMKNSSHQSFSQILIEEGIPFFWEIWNVNKSRVDKKETNQKSIIPRCSFSHKERKKNIISHDRIVWLPLKGFRLTFQIEISFSFIRDLHNKTTTFLQKRVCFTFKKLCATQLYILTNSFLW